MHKGHLGVKREGVQDLHGERLGWGLGECSIQCCCGIDTFFLLLVFSSKSKLLTQTSNFILSLLAAKKLVSKLVARQATSTRLSLRDEFLFSSRNRDGVAGVAGTDRLHEAGHDLQVERNFQIGAGSRRPAHMCL